MNEQTNKGGEKKAADGHECKMSLLQTNTSRPAG
jgi:hypothetical protein